jgi:hypothetical protein
MMQKKYPTKISNRAALESSIFAYNLSKILCKKVIVDFPQIDLWAVVRAFLNNIPTTYYQRPTFQQEFDTILILS